MITDDKLDYIDDLIKRAHRGVFVGERILQRIETDEDRQEAKEFIADYKKEILLLESIKEDILKNPCLC